MPDDLDTLKGRLAAELPGRILAALANYQRFADDEPPADAKGFAAWHAAAKAALTHVEVLVKLARWAGGQPDAEASGDPGLAHLLAEARAAVGDGDDEWEDDEP